MQCPSMEAEKRRHLGLIEAHAKAPRFRTRAHALRPTTHRTRTTVPIIPHLRSPQLTDYMALTIVLSWRR